ncbi:MAG: M1 family metallopeptidase [Gemmatimonadaceae bacterium]|nr:M1 family metallopeptidase [Gemmatimonadaceae bacterium]
MRMAVTVACSIAASVSHARAQAGTAVHPGPLVPTRPSPGVGAIGPVDRFPYAPGIDVQHYDLALTLPARGSEVRGVATLTVLRDRAVDTLRLDLIALSVDTVTVNGRARDVIRDSATVRVPLRSSDGSRLRVVVRYHGAPRDGLIVREDSTRGWSAFGDNWPNRARFWIPSIDHPSDKATVSWRVTAPAGRTVVANGTRLTRGAPVSHRDGIPWVTTRFAMSQPIPTYLMVIGAATLRETRLGRTACGAGPDGGCVPQSVWTFVPETPTMPGNFREAGRIVSTFAALAGPFAYAHLDHVQSATRFGGMENATAIFYSDQAFRTQGVGVSLIAHETAHQWFGDAVTPQRWADLWLSEGFATYFAAVYTQRSRGDSAFRAELQRIRGEILAAPVVVERPVVDSVGSAMPMSLLNANSYQKGGFVLHMLRVQLGDPAFFGALRDYQRRYRHGTATTDNLQRLLERRAGTSLTPFFAQWLHRPGWAEWTITWTWRAETSSLVMQVVQGTRFAPFAAPLTLVVRDRDGRETMVRTQVSAVPSQQVVVKVPGVRDVADLVADPRVELLGTVTLLHAMP